MVSVKMQNLHAQIALVSANISDTLNMNYFKLWRQPIQFNIKKCIM